MRANLQALATELPKMTGTANSGFDILVLFGVTKKTNHAAGALAHSMGEKWRSNTDCTSQSTREAESLDMTETSGKEWRVKETKSRGGSLSTSNRQ